MTTKWVQDENRPEVYCPITDDMQVMVELFYTAGPPLWRPVPTEVIGTFICTGTGVIRITLGDRK